MTLHGSLLADVTFVSEKWWLIM